MCFSSKLIENYCNAGNAGCYAEVAFNEISENIHLLPFDVRARLCMEIDTAEDLETVRAYVAGGQV
jgi:choline kinase